MADYNPTSPTTLGNEWFITKTTTSPLNEGPGWTQLLPSLNAETIESLKAEFTVDNNVVPSRSLHTIWEVVPFGNEDVAPPSALDLRPNSDVTIESWTTLTGSTINLFDGITSNIEWPSGAVQAEGIEDETGFANYICTVDASAFAGGGLHENSRIGAVELGIVAAVPDSTTQRKVRLELIHNGTDVFNPVSPNTTAGIPIHLFGEAFTFSFGELNPATELPWTAADIASFDVGGDWTIRVRSQESSVSATVTVYSVALRVWVTGDENRVAIGKWVRPTSSIGDILGLYEMETDQFVSWPDQTAGWDKPVNTDGFWYIGRQARSRYLHSGGGLSKDARWIRQWQALGSGGNPSGNSFAPSGLRGDLNTFSVHGIPIEPFSSTSLVSNASLAPIVTGGIESFDSQPYRLRSVDNELITPTSPVAQRVTADQTASYSGVRAVIAPPSSGDSTLRVSVHRISDGDQVGGVAEFPAQDVRDLPEITGSTAISGLRYIEDFLTTPAPLVVGVDYEIRFSVSDSPNWTILTPRCQIGPTASFQGTNGIFVGDTEVTDRDLTVTLSVSPTEPQNFTATIVDECVNTFACVSSVQHVRLDWDAGQPLLGDDFTQYQIERQVIDDIEGTPCEPFQPSMLALNGALGSQTVTAPSGAYQPGVDELHVIVELNADDWAPPGDEVLVSVWPDNGTYDMWQVGITSSGEPFLTYNTSDGADPPGIAATINRIATTSVTVPPGEWRFLRYTLTPDDGTGGNETIFEISPDGGDWTFVGTPVTGTGDDPVFPGAAPLVVGGFAGAEFSGDIRQVTVNVAGTTVASPRFNLEDPGTMTFDDVQGNTWNVNDPAEIVEDPSAPLISPSSQECPWDRVADINDEQTTEFIDREAPRCKDVRYRIRAVGEGGANSIWVESTIVAPRPTDGEVILTSNHAPWLEVVYSRTPEVPYTFLDHEADVTVPIYGSDFQVSFFESEDRGVEVQMDLYVNFVDIPRDRFGNVIGGAAVFEPLRCITRSHEIPYVVVLDHEGNVYRAHVQLTDGQSVEPGHRYTLTIVITPVTQDIVPVEVD